MEKIEINIKAKIKNTKLIWEETSYILIVFTYRDRLRHKEILGK